MVTDIDYQIAFVINQTVNVYNLCIFMFIRYEIMLIMLNQAFVSTQLICIKQIVFASLV
jgi:hypothetical protein